jgi:hypothetical protein
VSVMLIHLKTWVCQCRRNTEVEYLSQGHLILLGGFQVPLVLTEFETHWSACPVLRLHTEWCTLMHHFMVEKHHAKNSLMGLYS